MHQVAELWREGSVIRSWLLDLAARAFDPDPSLGAIAPVVQDSGKAGGPCWRLSSRAFPLL